MGNSTLAIHHTGSWMIISIYILLSTLLFCTLCFYFCFTRIYVACSYMFSFSWLLFVRHVLFTLFFVSPLCFPLCTRTLPPHRNLSNRVPETNAWPPRRRHHSTSQRRDHWCQTHRQQWFHAQTVLPDVLVAHTLGNAAFPSIPPLPTCSQS